ncbi:MAG: hypothetical protein MOGMAGMI_01125 [Candidatus Omnitrophica bacterium]|nr:hypothetical protein [Candidatus Omnitrophota bacterium]
MRWGYLLGLLLAAGAVVTVLCVRYSPAQDLIEVRGAGFLTGKVIRESAGSVVFVSAEYGEVEYARRDITLLERTAAEGFYGLSFRPPRLKELSPRDVLRSLDGLVRSDAAARRLREDAGRELERLLYHERRAPDLYERVRREIHWGLGEPSRGRLTPMRLLGALFVFLSLFFTAYFTVQGMVIMFSEGFVWGLAFLSLGYAFVADWLGGPFAAYLALLPPAAMVYFVITRWEAARGPLVGQVFSVNFGLIGVLILRSS